MRGKLAAVAALAMLSVPLAAGPALAEGSFTSSLSGVLTSFDSRTWNDGNRDGAATNITLRGCTRHGDRPANTQLQLTQQRGGPLPDINRGRKVFNCASSASHSWGRQGNAGYHFTVIRINGQESGEQLWADYVGVSY